MDPLDREHTALIVDHCLGLCTPSGAEKARELIDDSELAAELHSQVQTALAFLSCLPVESCPDYLAELTIDRLRRLAAQKAREEGRGPRIVRANPHQWFRNVAAVTAVAAAIVVVASVFIRPTPPAQPRQYLEVPPQSRENLLPNLGLYGSDSIRFQNTGWPDVPSSIINVYGPIEHYPGRLYHFIELDPQIVPAEWEKTAEHPFPESSVEPPSSLGPDTER